MGGVGRFGVVGCVQEVEAAPGELVTDADLIHDTSGGPAILIMALSPPAG